MDEYISIFQESNEDLGLMYKSYKPLANVVNSFLDELISNIATLNKEGTNANINLSNQIKAFKKDIGISMEPKAINIKEIDKYKSDIKSFQKEIKSILSKYIKARDSISYGGNLFRSVIMKPKVYNNNLNDEAFDNVNRSIRSIARAMDWVEKSILDLYNLADQDLNILTLVDSCYVKHHIYESAPACVMLETDADIVQLLPESKADINTRDKKTSTAPDYIKNNHDMAKWGEDDDNNAPEKKLDDYKRPERPTAEPSDDVLDAPIDTGDTPAESKERQQAIQNYYYYTYNNSLNKNSRDDHSVRDDHSTKVDDHSVNKNSKETKKKEAEYHQLESSFKLMEAVGDADNNKPQSDHPIQDILTDIDRETVKHQQNAKKAVQNITNVGRAAVKPIKRTAQWIDNMVHNWKDADETKVKERLADPHARNNLFHAIKVAINGGALLKAGILLNPVFLFLTITRSFGKNKREFRIRNEMIGEIKTEITIIDEKIKDADQKGDNKAKYELMRFKNELNKKLMRVGGGKGWSKIL